MKRITVIMPDEVYDKVIALAKTEKRKKSPMAAMLIEDGLKMPLQRETISMLYGTSEIHNFIKGYFGISDEEADRAIESNFR